MADLIKVTLCRSCVKAFVASDPAVFAANVKDELNVKDSENRWEIDLGPCLDICPDKKISIAIAASNDQQVSIITTSEDSTIESVVQRCFERGVGK